MQHVFKKSSNTYFVSEERPTLSFNEETYQNFAETLPTEISLKIFRQLDTHSLCNALLTCKLWYHIIEDSDHIWRDHCLVVRAVCQRQIDGDRQCGMSWKVTLVRNYKRSLLKRDWLRGRYSNVHCADELLDTYMCPLDVETWGEILEAELDR
ncbi:F-box only protein 48 [Osmerus eperlanus]|uniref:F-box only protein 48 n=1 Tax=Osmerus eperlanus TaxID=29151 RepID=UPI002E1082FE